MLILNKKTDYTTASEESLKARKVFIAAIKPEANTLIGNPSNNFPDTMSATSSALLLSGVIIHFDATDQRNKKP